MDYYLELYRNSIIHTVYNSKGKKRTTTRNQKEKDQHKLVLN